MEGYWEGMALPAEGEREVGLDCFLVRADAFEASHGVGYEGKGWAWANRLAKYVISARALWNLLTLRNALCRYRAGPGDILCLCIVADSEHKPAQAAPDLSRRHLGQGETASATPRCCTPLGGRSGAQLYCPSCRHLGPSADIAAYNSVDVWKHGKYDGAECVKYKWPHRPMSMGINFRPQTSCQKMPPQTLIAPYTNLPKLKLEKLPNGTNIAYRCLPPIPNRTLPTLFLIHPLLTDSTFFAPQFSDPALGRGTIWNLIAVDVHGHGYTSGRSNFDYWDMAEDVGLLMVADSRMLIPAPG